MTDILIETEQQAEIESEDQGGWATEIPIKDLLDRVELLNPDLERARLLRRAYTDRDLSAIFKLCDGHDDLRRAVMEDNLHSLFRVLESYSCLAASHDDLRKSVIEKNLYSVFRLLEAEQCLALSHDDLRRAVLDKNLHSLFRVLESYSCLAASHDDLRKSVIEKNLHSIFRLLEPHNCSASSHDDLRKSVIEKNLHSIFRVLEPHNCSASSHDDLRRAVIDQNLHSIFRLYDEVDDLRSAVADQNLYGLFRLYDGVDDLRKAVADQNLHSLLRLYDDVDDLRRAVADQNLHSLFRLYDGVDDLRKAIIDKNLHSLFRLMDLDDLSKMILNDNRYSMYRLIESIYDSHIIEALKKLENKNIQFAVDCMSRGQLKSKIWLIEQLTKLDLDLGCVFLCAGWYATLATMIFESGITVKKIRSFDLDPSCKAIAEIFNSRWVKDEWKFKAVTKDIFDINFRLEEYQLTNSKGDIVDTWDVPDTVINTSCEHIEDFENWYAKIPEGVLVILQTNDFVSVQDHVNCSLNLHEFSNQTPMSECLFSEELDLGNYRRFMRIGYR